MNKNCIASVVAIALVLACPTEARADLRLDWGSANEGFLIEESDGSAKPESTRSFVTSERHRDAMDSFFSRHEKAWKAFQTQTGITTDTEHKFPEWVKANDRFLSMQTTMLAPELYFDFIGEPEKQYVLTRVEIETIDFMEYKGGGFAQNTSTYDLTVSIKPGVASYKIDPKLVFKGTGSCKLRFWSDNYAPGNGMVFAGKFTLKLSFIFLESDKEVRVSTGKFFIDI